VGTFDPQRLLRVKRERLVNVRDRAIEVQLETHDPRVIGLALELIKAAEPVVGRTYRTDRTPETRWLADPDGTIGTVEQARKASLELGSSLLAMQEDQSLSDHDHGAVTRLGEIHRDLETCLVRIEGDLRRLLTHV
jgi:hypothetical protein